MISPSLSSVLWLAASLSGLMGSKLGVDRGAVLAVGWRFSLLGLDMFVCYNLSKIRVCQKISDWIDNRIISSLSSRVPGLAVYKIVNPIKE